MTSSAERTSFARQYLLEAGRGIAAAAEANADDIATAAALIADRVRHGGKVLVCGNGGSAADAQHFAAELVSCLDKRRIRRAIPALALTTDTSVLTAIGNDFGFDGVFERQVDAIGREGDALLAISTSGNSENVLRAVSTAKERGMATVALTGGDGGMLRAEADVAVVVAGDEPGHIQEAQLAIEHLLATLVERELTSDQPS